MSSRAPTIAHVIRRALEVHGTALRVGLPGRVEKFDPATQLADVKPLLKEAYDLDDETVAVESLPVIVSVPVYSPGGQDFALTMPVKPGDSCWLLFSDRSLDLWNELGGEQDPIDPRRHDLSDAVCIVGVRPKAGKLSEYDADAIQLGKSGGPRVRVKADTVHLGVNSGQDASESAVLGSTYRQNEDAWFNDLTAQLTTAGAQLQTASIQLAAAATANAVPITGGGAAAAPFGAAATALGSAAAALAQVAAKLTVFLASSSTYLSQKVKVK